MQFAILGPLVVWRDGREVPIGAAKQRALLALLLLRRGELVRTETIVDELWGEQPPATAVKTVQVYVSQLRKALGPGVLETRPTGYLLAVEPAAVDAVRFEQMLTRADGLLASGDPHGAAELLADAFALWRGPPLAEFRYEDFARNEIARLEELRLSGLELRLKTDLAAGRHGPAIPKLEALVREHPLREGPRALLMLALYRAGRQADALEVYQEGRAALVEELGLEPGESLRRLQAAILRHDPTLDLRAGAGNGLERASARGAVPAAGHARGGGARKAIVLLACGALATGAAVAAAVMLGRGGSSSAKATAVLADSVGIFNPTTGKPAGEIPVGASPSAVAVGDGSLWVANLDAHTVSRIDPVKQVLIDTIQVGNGPAGIAFGGGFVWAANGLDGTVTKIDPTTNTPVDVISVGNGPAGLAVGSRYVWVANSSDGTVTRIDMRTDKPLKPIPVGQSADGVAIGFGSVWVTSEAGGTVTRIDERSGTPLQPIQAGSGADALTAGAGAVWVANSLDGTVARVDPNTNSVRAVIPVGDSPDGIAVEAGAIWVSNELSGTLSKIDPARNAPSVTVRIGNRPEGVVFDSGSLFVAVRASGLGHRGGTLRVLDSGVTGDLVHLDPALAYSYGESQLVTLTNDGLTGFRRVGGAAGESLVPDLAVSLPVPADAGRSYTFQLRPGIHYSNGALVRPRDFRRAIERTLALSHQGAFYALYYAGIVGARKCLANPGVACDLSKGIVTDAASNTITFRLTAPDPDLLERLALPSADAVPAGTPLHPHGFVPATGPYEIASFDPEHAVTLVRNPHFREWSPAAQPSGFPTMIVEHVDGSPNAHVAAVLRGSADLASQLNITKPSTAVLASVRTHHASALEVNPWDLTVSLALNTRIGPFDNLRARQALNFAVDRDRLKELTLGPGLGQVTCQILPPDFDGYRPYCPYTADRSASGTWTAPDLVRARQLVRASGTAGQAVTVWIPAWTEIGPAAGRYVVSVLDSLGYKARFRLAANPYSSEDKRHVQLGFIAWYPDFATPAGIFNATLTCTSYNRVNTLNQNFAEFCDPAIDREIATAESLQTSDLEAASKLWAKVDRDMTNEAPWVPFANAVELEVKSQRVGDYQFNPVWGTLLDRLWVR